MSIDIIIGLMLAFAIVKGYRRGAVEIIVSFVIFIAALVLSSMFGTQVGKALLGSSYLHPFIGFLIVFVGLLVVGSVITKSIKPKKGFFAGLDKIFGAAIGGIRMLLIIGLIAAGFRIVHLPSSETARSSKFYGIAIRATAMLVSQVKPLATTVSDDIFNDRPPIINQ